MNKIFQWVMLLGLAYTIMGCEGTTYPSINMPSKPSNLMATSINQNSVRIKWTPPKSTVIGYTISLLDPMLSIIRTEQIGTDSVYQFDDLNEGIVFTFRVQARSADTVSNPIDIKWAAARRVEGTLYFNESLSCGYNFLNASTLSIQNASQWDICVVVDSTVNPISYSLSTPRASSFVDNDGTIIRGIQAGISARKTYIFNFGINPFVYQNIDSLSQIFDTSPIGTALNPLENIASDIQEKDKGFILLLKTASRNYVKMFVKEKNGSVIQKDNKGVFIQFEASVQSVPDIAFAKRN
jgi:hypothetical protein